VLWGWRERKLRISGGLSLTVNLGLLFLFKYFNLFNDSLRQVFSTLNIFYGVPEFKALLPIGISFYTFQTLSYSIDVYLKTRPAEKHFGIFALFVSFFPQLVAGPIERSSRLLPQFFMKHEFNYRRVRSGLLLMLWGFIMKIVIADRLAIPVDRVFGNPTAYNGVPMLIAVYFFSIQIFCDFAGYSNIAIGAARVMGYELMTNFRRPYFSQSIAEFWKRWHISLSTWFRDYLYIPLGGNRVSKSRWVFNIITVFLLSGLWHGANWTFLIWGFLHGFYFLFSSWTQTLRTGLCSMTRLDLLPRLHRFIKIVVTFHLVCLAWIFFRANSNREALYILTHLFSGIEFKIRYGLGLGLFEMSVAVSAILILGFVEYWQSKRNLGTWFYERSLVTRWTVYYAMVLLLVFFGHFSGQKFIYFQF